MTIDNRPKDDDRARSRTRRQRLGAIFTVLIFGVGMFSQCAANRTVNQSEAPESGAVRAQPIGALTSAKPSEHTARPMINTGSVLFPQHTMSERAIAEQQELFMTGLEEFEPTSKQIATVTELRSGPSELNDVVEILTPGEEIVVDGKIAHWYRVTDNAGFVSGQAVADEFPGVAWAVTETNSGDSDAVNACTGGLTNFSAMTNDLGVPVYAIHSYCGGEPVLKLNVGDQISIDGVRYRVASRNDFPLFSSTEVMHNLKADAFLHTGDLAKGTSRVLGLVLGD